MIAAVANQQGTRSVCGTRKTAKGQEFGERTIQNSYYPLSEGQLIEMNDAAWILDYLSVPHREDRS